MNSVSVLAHYALLFAGTIWTAAACQNLLQRRRNHVPLSLDPVVNYLNVVFSLLLLYYDFALELPAILRFMDAASTAGALLMLIRQYETQPEENDRTNWFVWALSAGVLLTALFTHHYGLVLGKFFGWLAVALSLILQPLKAMHAWEKNITTERSDGRSSAYLAAILYVAALFALDKVPVQSRIIGIISVISQTIALFFYRKTTNKFLKGK